MDHLGKAEVVHGQSQIGTHAVRIPRNSSIQRTVSTVGWQDIKVSFWLGARLRRSGASFQALWFDGVTWELLKGFYTGNPEADGQLHYCEYSLPPTAANNSKFALRFRLSSRSHHDAGYVDDVAVNADSPFMYTLTLAGASGSVKVNGVAEPLPWSGAFGYGATVVLQAEPDSGYHFTGWSGALTGSDNPAIILMDRNKDITASFAVNSYRLAMGSGTGHGSVKVDGVLQSLPWVGTFDDGTAVLLEAVPDASYHFTGWAGGLTGTTNPEFITMDGNQSVSAGFASDTYVLHLSGSGGVNVDGVYLALPDTVIAAHGSTVTLEAVPAEGWHFTGWSGDLSGTASPTSLLMDSDKSVTVESAINQYDLHLSGTGNGSVRVEGTDHPLPWSGTFSYGDILVLEALPSAGSHFMSWLGDLHSSANPTVITMDGAKNIVASFGLDTYTLTVTGSDGTVEVNGVPKILPWSGPFAAGEVANLKAVPSEGYHFVSWSGDLIGSANPTAISMDGDHMVAAEFGVDSCNLTVTGVHGSLNVDSVPQALPYSATYDYGAVVSLEALPDIGYQFTGWSGDITGPANPVDVTIAGNTNIGANFNANSYTLNLFGAGGEVKVNGVAQSLPWSGDYDYGVSVTLEAVPDSCMRFSGWSGDVVTWDNPTAVAVDGNKSITAEFDSIVIFSDVGCDFWAAREIAACSFQGIVAGYPDGSYKPTASVTRDQMAVYISRALAGGDALVPSGPTQPSFPDVPADHWAFKYVEFARSQQIVQGYPDGSYQPAVALDRGQMAVFIARAVATPTDRLDLASYSPPTTATFADVPASFWSFKYIEYIAQPSIGVAHGYTDGLYHPEYLCSRDQMAVYIQRVFKLPL